MVITTRKKSDKVYFTEDTEKAIIAYNKSDDPDTREQLFRSKIQGPLDKLAENVINNNNSYKEEKRVLYFSDQTEDSFTLEEMLIVEPETRDSTVDMKEFLKLLVQYWEFNTTKIFKKKRDIEIATAIVKLIERIDNIDNFNKKALYLMVREMTNYKTAHITKVINKMRPHIIRMLGEFRVNGHLSDPSSYFSYKR